MDLSLLQSAVSLPAFPVPAVCGGLRDLGTGYMTHASRSCSVIRGSGFFASLKAGVGRRGNRGERALGFFHFGTGFWLFYLMFAGFLNALLKFTLFLI